jgi:putative transposase
VEEVRGGQAGPFEDLEVIRVEAGMSTARFCQLIDMPERTWRRWQAKARAGDQPKGPWPRPARLTTKEVTLKHALAHPAWGHRKIWAMVRHDGHVVSQATVLRLLRDEDLILPAKYQRERRKLAERRKAAFGTDPTAPNQVWQLDFSEFETTSGGTWRLAGCRDYWSKYEHPFHVSPTANQHDAIDAIELALADYEAMFGHPMVADCPVDVETGELLPVVTIVTDNGGRFRSFRFEAFIELHPELAHVRTRVKTPGQNGSRERGFGTLKYERLYIDEIDDAVMLAKHAEEYRIEYNQIRPHEAIAWNRPRRCTLAWPTPASRHFKPPKSCQLLDAGHYDVTTLYFEAEKEDDGADGLRKVGYSKERRVDPQIVVGLLVDRHGFPLEIGCYQGNKAETLTIVPNIKQFQDRHDLAEMVVVADAGMLSAGNLRELDEANLRFIVGSRVTKTPVDLESHFRWHGDAFIDGQLIDTITPKNRRVVENDPKLKKEPVWNPGQHPGSWRAVWACSAKRATRDGRTLTLQENRAKAVIAGEKAARTPRFVKTRNGAAELDEKALARARRLVGLKGYVTNIPASLMPAGEVIANYHDLWHVEQSFQMPKTDLRARPMFAPTRDAIEAHLTIVFTALAVSRETQNRTGMSLRRVLRTLRLLRSATVELNGVITTVPPALSADEEAILSALQTPTPRH